MNVSPLISQNRDKLINPERLTEAREAKGLTMADLARLLEISRQAISAFEKGLKNPSHETLNQISRVLSFPESFFLAAESSPSIKGAVHFRSRASASKKERLMGTTKGRWVSGILSNLLQYAILPELKLPPIDIDDFEMLTPSDLEDIATQTRRYWGLGDGPIKNLTQLLENNGIVVSNIHAGDRVDAFSFWANSGPIIVSDKNCTAVRLRFTIAHELGHLILHRSVQDDYLDDKELFKKVEKQADYFASCFLLPASTFGNEFFSPSLQGLIKLKERWGVSIGAITMRAASLHLINDNQKEYVFRQLAPYRKKEPLDDVIKSEEPKLINKLAHLLDEHNIISKSELFERSALPDADFIAITKIQKAEIYSEKENVISLKLK
ncbi:helix-turn-helix domain-containing protein [Cronobacter dublinensis]|uniref:helix-turn-helix domain-containing protein n=1 Tax=Cronobacter dublinensis TaxID=413497 RepID=UPI001376395A|nr:XRE family transcriptional regulator [Cronobacter dublinensis]EKY3090889.1 ImmA/IrrE family metallo-endopeptidase [Cronobacter dublinensis]EKY3091141.1 ImmA/IrrE family metallo-endopeptidase [Cronobacter dublinensis]ELQ6231230.1 ImmA/IrrE family metallo-endopeptidase [Cronobacter dublinensis]ELY4003952.1 ImmA/IrrE family metallo-endopeptidase [Cronobacter dublinensis]ELY4410533.1 ImmA/IrrE family metallo-endopeptidase [Cronobacter dublinensis]